MWVQPQGCFFQRIIGQGIRKDLQRSPGSLGWLAANTGDSGSKENRKITEIAHTIGANLKFKVKKKNTLG